MRAGNEHASPRFRGQRRSGAAAIRRTISAMAEPRSVSTGIERSRRSGSHFSSSFTAINNAGIPATGKRHKIVGFYRVGSTTDVIG